MLSIKIHDDLEHILFLCTTQQVTDPANVLVQLIFKCCKYLRRMIFNEQDT